MGQYSDYGWQDRATDAHSYLYLTLSKILNESEYKAKKILDVGCGNGEIASRLLNAGFDVYGIDASETGVAIANRKSPGRFFLHDVSNNQLPQDMESLQFDVVISTEVIEHLYNPRAYVQLIRNILPNDGVVIISTPYHGYLKNLVLALTNKMDGHFTALWDGGHIKFWSKLTLTKLLNEFGFNVVKFKGSGRVPLLWKSMFVVAKLSK